VSPDFFQISEQRRETEPIILCVSTLHPHKNIGRLVRAFAVLAQRRPEYRLVLAGMRGFHTMAIEQEIQALGLTDRVEITGWIQRAELLDLFRRARAFVYPSTFEGFGMPVLEAMAAGVPLACSDIEPLRGIANSSAVLFPPDNEHAIADALERLVTEDSSSRVQLGQECAREFTWKRAAEQTLTALQRARS
jgi:glycosyltransferase involved in cell wall biosynthesis